MDKKAASKLNADGDTDIFPNLEDSVSPAALAALNPSEQTQLALTVPPSTALTVPTEARLTVQSDTASSGLESYVRTMTPNAKNQPPPRSLLMDRTPPPASSTQFVNESVPYIGTITAPDDPFESTPLADDDEEDPFSADLLQEPLLRNLNLGRSRRVTTVPEPTDENVNGWQDACSFKSTTSMVLVVLFALGLAVLILVLDNETCSNSSSTPSPTPSTPWFPAAVRYQHVLECVAAVSDLTQAPPSTLQSQAVDWFLTGPGRTVPIPWTAPSTPLDCDAAFAPLFSLIALRDAIHVPDESWYSTTHVSNLSDVCAPAAAHWTRIECDNDNGVPHISGLSFNHANLTGSFPMEMVVGVPHLTSLDAFTNANLVGTLPACLSNLTLLQHLKLHETGIYGSIPDSWSQLTALETLLLHDTQITGSVPEAMCQLTSLTNIQVPTTVACSCCKPMKVV